MAEKRPAVPRRISAAILNSLSAGVVPRTGLEYIAIGRTNEINALLEDLANTESGGSAFRLITGRYGSGKSFLIQLMRSHAMERGFATADADLSPERRLTGSKGQGLATYRELIKNLSLKASPDGGGLPVILSRWIASLQVTAAKENGFAPGSAELKKAVETAVLETVTGFENMVHGFDFSAAIITYYRGVTENDDGKKQAALRWLRGEFATKTEARAALPVSAIIDDDSWYDYLKLITALVTAAGQKGLVVFIDEAVNLYKIVQTNSREANYEKLLTIFNDATQGRLSNLAFVFGGTPQFLEDTRRGLFSYEALRSRLSENRYSAAGRQDFSAPVLRLETLTPEELLALLKRILSIHAEHNEWTPPVTDAQLAALVANLAGRMGADSMLTPREVVRDFTGLLNILRQHPEESFDSLVASLDIKPADKESAAEEEFAEFEL
jgi:hypothetical protein